MLKNTSEPAILRLFSQAPPTYFSPSVPSHIVAIFRRYGGMILDPDPSKRPQSLPPPRLPPDSTSSTCLDTPSPPPRISNSAPAIQLEYDYISDPIFWPVSLYLVNAPHDPMIPHLSQASIVLFSAEWIVASFEAEEEVAMAPFRVNPMEYFGEHASIPIPDSLSLRPARYEKAQVSHKRSREEVDSEGGEEGLEGREAGKEDRNLESSNLELALPQTIFDLRPKPSREPSPLIKRPRVVKRHFQATHNRIKRELSDNNACRELASRQTAEWIKTQVAPSPHQKSIPLAEDPLKATPQLRRHPIISPTPTLVRERRDKLFFAHHANRLHDTPTPYRPSSSSNTLVPSKRLT